MSGVSFTKLSDRVFPFIKKCLLRPDAAPHLAGPGVALRDPFQYFLNPQPQTGMQSSGGEQCSKLSGVVILPIVHENNGGSLHTGLTLRRQHQSITCFQRSNIAVHRRLHYDLCFPSSARRTVLRGNSVEALHRY